VIPLEDRRVSRRDVEMLPISWFVLVMAGWALWRTVAFMRRVLVAHRSRGWRALLVLGGFAYALPVALHGGRWAAPIVLLAVDAFHGMLPAPLWPRRPTRTVITDVGGAEVIPLRPR
jgi:hypothetical protein